MPSRNATHVDTSVNKDIDEQLAAAQRKPKTTTCSTTERREPDDAFASRCGIDSPYISQ